MDGQVVGAVEGGLDVDLAHVREEEVEEGGDVLGGVCGGGELEPTTDGFGKPFEHALGVVDRQDTVAVGDVDGFGRRGGGGVVGGIFQAGDAKEHAFLGWAEVRRVETLDIGVPSRG